MHSLSLYISSHNATHPTLLDLDGFPILIRINRTDKLAISFDYLNTSFKKLASIAVSNHCSICSKEALGAICAAL